MMILCIHPIYLFYLFLSFVTLWCLNTECSLYHLVSVFVILTSILRISLITHIYTHPYIHTHRGTHTYTAHTLIIFTHLLYSWNISTLFLFIPLHIHNKPNFLYCESVLVCVSITVIKQHDEKAIWGGRVYLAYSSLLLFIHQRKSGPEHKWQEPVACSACIL